MRPGLQDGWVHSVLVRRHPERTHELAYYLVYAPTGTPLEEAVRVAGARWTIEETFKAAKGLVGLDHYEVRSWQGWYRHITLALLAFAALTIATRKRGPSRRSGARAISRSPSRRSVGSSSDSSGPRPVPHQRMPRSWPGPAGDGTIRKSPRTATSVAA